MTHAANDALNVSHSAFGLGHVNDKQLSKGVRRRKKLYTDIFWICAKFLSVKKIGKTNQMSEALADLHHHAGSQWTKNSKRQS